MKEKNGLISEFQEEKERDLILDYNHIEFTEEIGEGASGKVFFGIFNESEVAIKVITTPNFKTQLEEFKKELEVMKVVNSSYCVRLYGITIEPKLCMVMELCKKGSLYSILKTSKNLSWDMVLSFAIDMCHGLYDLHNSGIVHRDFKSLNLLVTNEMRCKVCDFGLSRSTAGNVETFKKLKGTYAYCAPEVFTGTPCTYKSDIFSVGIVLWELMKVAMTGKYEQPYAEYSLQFDFQIIVQSSMGLRPNIPIGTPRSFVDLYINCINANPDLRPTANEVLQRIEEINQMFSTEPDVFLNDKFEGDIVFQKVEDLGGGPPKDSSSSNGSTTGNSSGFQGWGKKK